MLTPGTLLQNRYLIIRLLGQGGMGAVYEAEDQRLGNTVALKETFFSDYEMCSAFEREARLLAKLHHPALPVVSDHFVEGNGQFLVMQYIAGKDLHSMLTERSNPFSVAEVLRWADQLLDALEYLHAQQPPVIHRDIKPQNLKLTPRGQIVLLDFGLAKGEVAGMSHVSTGYSVKGYTPAYAPPEQIHGRGTDPRSDLYSLAATLYHLLTGHAPADALTRLVALPQGEPDPLVIANKLNPQVPSGLAAALHRAMALNRDQRPQSAIEMRRALISSGNQTTVRDEPPTFVTPRNAEGRRQNEQPTMPARGAQSDPARMAPTEIAPQYPTAQGGAGRGTSPTQYSPPATGNAPGLRPTVPVSPPAGGSGYRFAEPTSVPSNNPMRWLIVIVLIAGAAALIYYLASRNSSDEKSRAPGGEPHIAAEIANSTTPYPPPLGSYRESWVEANQLMGSHRYHIVRCRYQINSPSSRQSSGGIGDGSGPGVPSRAQFAAQEATPQIRRPIYGIKVIALFHFKDGSRVIDRNSNYGTASGQIGVQGESSIVYKDRTTYYDIKLYLPQSALPEGEGYYAVIDIRSEAGESLATYKTEPFNSGSKYAR